MVGTRWKNRSNMSIGLVSVPFLSMINFSNTCGMGLKGARIMKTANTIRIEYGILSRNAHMIFLKGVTKSKNLLIFQLNDYLSRK
jgi:hypothetical protein